MLRTRLLTATAAIALFAAGSAFAQSAPIATPSAGAQTTTGQTVLAPAAPDSSPPAAGDAPDTPAAAQAQNAEAPAGTTVTVVENNVVEVLRANGQFTTLLAALDAAQLTETLSTQPAISIFAPTDAAFAALPEADRTRLLDPANVNELRQLLLYHVVVADVTSAQIDGTRGGVQTAATTEVQLDGTGDAIKVDNATVTTADVDAGNGSIFVIDRVLNPADSMVATGDAEAATAPAVDDTAAETPPVDGSVEGPPADDADATDDSATADAMDADSADDEGAVAPPPTMPAAPTPAAPAMTSPNTAAPTAPTTTTRPASGATAPNGQPATTTTTVASPTVPNPTDGQTDGDDEDADETPTPTPQS